MGVLEQLGARAKAQHRRQAEFIEPPGSRRIPLKLARAFTACSASSSVPPVRKASRTTAYDCVRAGTRYVSRGATGGVSVRSKAAENR
jgi:hypothetical protein